MSDGPDHCRLGEKEVVERQVEVTTTTKRARPDSQAVEETDRAESLVAEGSRVDTIDASKMRLRLSNIPSMFGVSQVRKFVADALGIPQTCIVCRKGPGWSHALLTFRAPVGEGMLGTASIDLEAFRSRLDGLPWKRIKLAARLERAWESSALTSSLKRNSNGTNESSTKSLADQVTPLWNIPYAEQLERKEAKLKTLLRQKFPPSTTVWEMEPIKASLITEGYRNKCEFTIGLGTDGQPTVGFLLGGFREGIVTVANAQDTLHVPPVLKLLANHLQEHVRASGLPVFDRARKEGFWRLALARVHDDKVMLAVQVSGPAPVGALESLTEHMQSFVAQDGSRPLHSLFTQETEALHHGVDPKAPFILRSGEETIQQTLLGLGFRISPLSFFQVNIPATEILYNTIGDYVMEQHREADDMYSGAAPPKRPKEEDPETLVPPSMPKPVLLDLCCGTGTIGMTLAARVDRVIGVELVKEAIADAQANAAANGITNIEFICERVETAMENVIASIPPTQPIVVVLDPPRAGVHPSVIKSIRKCMRISRVVFVACNAEASAGNMVDLSRAESRAMIGAPFTLKRAVAIDLFPHTEHCELLLQFAR